MWGFCKKKYFYFHCQHDEWYINGGNMVLSYFDPLSSWRHGGWILWVESHHDYNHDYDQHHHDWQGPRCHGVEPGSPHARRRVHPAMRQVSCHRILGWFFKCILSLLITQYLCIWSLALLIAKFFSFQKCWLVLDCDAGPGRFVGRPLFSRAWNFSARWTIFPLEKNPKIIYQNQMKTTLIHWNWKGGGKPQHYMITRGRRGGWIHPENDNVIYGEPLKVVWLPGKQRESTKTIIL